MSHHQNDDCEMQRLILCSGREDETKLFESKVKEKLCAPQNGFTEVGYFCDIWWEKRLTELLVTESSYCKYDHL